MMALLILTVCVALFLGVHLVPMIPSWRSTLVRGFGENAYKIVFAVLALIGLFGAIIAYRFAPHIQLWPSAPSARLVTTVLMLISVICFANAKFSPWFQRVVRHPMLWGMGLLGVAHLFANGEVPGLILFGGLALFGFVWQPLTDRRDAVVDPERWAELNRTTSLVPFAKWNATGDVAAQVTMRPLVVGVIAFVVLILLHPWLFGVPAIPL
ncbi:MAG: NnrU family protein [Alphaproteobacteria bacterium]